MTIWKSGKTYPDMKDGTRQAQRAGFGVLTERFIAKTGILGRPFARRIKGQILRPGRYCKAGHLSVVLGHGAAGSPVHQLVARTFLGLPQNNQEVRHKNGDPTDNRLENLEYGTRTENILDVFYQGRAWKKLTIEDVEEIRFGLSSGIRGAELARMYKVSDTTISNIRHGRIYSWLR